MSETNKNINVKVKSDGTPLKNLNAEIRKTKEEVARAAQEFGKSSKEFQNASNKLKGLQTQFTGLKKTVADAGNQLKMSKFQLLEFGENLTVVTAGLSVVAGKIANFGIDAFKMGAEFQEMSSNFVGSAQDLELFRKATAGTVADGSLIQLSNYASDLGVSLKDQALLFSLAEDAADKYGGTVQDNFERVINATDGSAKGLRAIGIGVKEYNKELEKLLPNNVKNIDDLDAETQQQIRLEAIINAKGITIDDVKDKQQSNADVIAGLSVLYQNFTTNVGLAMNENVKLGDSMTILSGKAETLGKAFGNFISEGLDKVSQKMQNDFKDYERLKNLIEDISRVANAFMSLDLEGQLMFLRNGMQWGMINVNDKNPTTDTGSDFPPEVKVDQFGRVITERQPTEDKPPPKVKTKTGSSNSRGGSKTKNELSESEKKKLADQEAILSINKLGEAEFYDLTKIKVPHTKDDKGLTDTSWMSLIPTDKELQSFLSLDQPTEEQSSTLLDDSQTIYNNISSLMNTLNVGTDTFVGKLLAGFGVAYQVLGIVGSILSFIPGGGVISKAFGARATGGMVNAGGTYLVGEQGPELLRMSGSGGMIYNNSQTNKLMNQSLNKSNPINIYVSSNIDQRYLKVGIEKYNSAERYIRV